MEGGRLDTEFETYWLPIESKLRISARRMGLLDEAQPLTVNKHYYYPFTPTEEVEEMVMAIMVKV
ncbi:hypothetical protein FIBSPDRAFT_863401 [Athelia psychrophila]|uniref:Uncharacterized protein n=1 Tax=Athelia psychrophila TaxID=1759441 RepID=A0A166HFV9_9AGAM|nr:hypothetical protein FIBSPDRAFT_863401 [Fibularhizoctonia sp. CBS 109695]